MAPIYYYLLCACCCLAVDLGTGVELPSNVRCQVLFAAIKVQSSWTVDYNLKVISWLHPSSGPIAVAACFCVPGVGRLGNVSRIEVTNSATGEVASNSLCSGCPGQEVPVTDFSVSVGIRLSDQRFQQTGPCNEISVYRCSCPGSILPTLPGDPYMT